jgi:hypothetical protein
VLLNESRPHVASCCSLLIFGALTDAEQSTVVGYDRLENLRGEWVNFGNLSAGISVVVQSNRTTTGISVTRRSFKGLSERV